MGERLGAEVLGLDSSTEVAPREVVPPEGPAPTLAGPAPTLAGRAPRLEGTARYIEFTAPILGFTAP